MTNHIHPPKWAVFNSYAVSLVLVLLGYLSDLYRRFFPDERQRIRGEEYKQGFATLLRDQDDFYIRRMYGRIRDCFSRPICSRPGSRFDILSRDYVICQIPKLNGQIQKNVINLSSYNYLGFAENPDYVNKKVFACIDNYGINTCSRMAEYGYTDVHRNLEQKIAKFLDHEDCLVFGMGFATNSTVIPALVGKGSLVLSDSLNHSSIVTGVRASGAVVKVFRHNDVAHLESLIRNSIAEGQPRTHREWKKILIIVEGIYSMEGEGANLKEIVELKKKYKCYLYLDEAHSIGAVGKTGRGITEQLGVDRRDVDIMMGTFTKSFGSIGGYIAGSKDIIEHLRTESFGPLYCSTLPTSCAEQVNAALEVILGEDNTGEGARRLSQIQDNCVYFRQELKKRGFDIIGEDYSPVVILMIYMPCALPLFSRLCLERGVAVVVVGPPACDLDKIRVRMCLSAAHTRKDLEEAVRVIDEVGDLTFTKHKKQGIYSALM